MRKILSLILSLSLSCPAFATPVQAPQVLNGNEIEKVMSGVKSLPQVLRILEAYARPGEFAELKDYLAAHGVTGKVELPKISARGTMVRFEGASNDLDFRYILFGKVDNGRSLMTINHERSLLSNLKAIQQFFKKGSYEVSWFDFIFPRANAAEDPTTAGAEVAGVVRELAVAVVVLGITMIGVSAAPPLLTAVGVAAIAGILLAAGDFLANGSTRKKNDLKVACRNGELVLNSGAGEPSGIPVEEYTGPIERDVREVLCKSPKMIADLNRSLGRMSLANPANASGLGQESASH